MHAAGRKPGFFLCRLVANISFPIAASASFEFSSLAAAR
jgi:hypothetical protein